MKIDVESPFDRNEQQSQNRQADLPRLRTQLLWGDGFHSPLSCRPSSKPADPADRIQVYGGAGYGHDFHGDAKRRAMQRIEKFQSRYCRCQRAHPDHQPQTADGHECRARALQQHKEQTREADREAAAPTLLRLCRVDFPFLIGHRVLSVSK